MGHKRVQCVEAEQFLKTLLVGAELATFEYWADFIVRIERDIHREHSPTERQEIPTPSVVWLRLEADWWVGNREWWEAAKASFPIKQRRMHSTNDVPMKAAAIAQMIGSAITSVAVSSDGTLSVKTSDEVTFSVCGVSDAHEYSWSIERRDDEFHVSDLLLVCETDGSLFGQSPGAFS